MCTSVVELIRAEGAGVSEGGWFPVTTAVVSYDHPHMPCSKMRSRSLRESEPRARGRAPRSEITLDTAKELAAALTRAITARRRWKVKGQSPLTRGKEKGRSHYPLSTIHDHAVKLDI